MAAQTTYTPIATVTATGSTNAYQFSSIPQTYTDIVLIGYCRSAQSAVNPGLYVRPNSGTGWSWTYLFGNGSTFASGRSTLNTGDGAAGIIIGNSATANVYASFETHFLNYSNTTTYKPYLTMSCAETGGAGGTYLWAATTNSTAAINNVIIYNDSNSNWMVGTTFTLYGITAA